MTEDDFRKKLPALNAVSPMAAQLKEMSATALVRADLLKAFEDKNLFSSISAVSEQYRDLIQSTVGPTAALKEAAAALDRRFHSPVSGELTRLMEDFRTRGSLISGFVVHNPDFIGLQQAMQRMQAPWIDMADQLRSFGAFAELQSLGRALSIAKPFNDDFMTTLRADLGDWRDRITWPVDVLTSLPARTDFYIERGFDPGLTDFPAAAFEEGLDRAGVRGNRPSLVFAYGPPVPLSSNPKEEAGLQRTNAVHDWLQRFETQLRQFIDREMTQAYGVDWPRHRLPNGIYERWVEKKRRDEQAGRQSFPLVCYADFTDYELVVCRADNWKEVFAVYFGRPESVRESFQRLYIPRITTMHSRPVTQDDELLVYVEVRRLMMSVSA